jgi:hypothetical protein
MRRESTLVDSFFFLESFIRCENDYFGKKVVLSGADERFTGEKGAIIGARSYVTGEYVAFYRWKHPH